MNSLPGRFIVKNWLISSPDPNISYGIRCKPLKIEMVVRGYLSGHSFRLYRSGLRNICGNIIPENMIENDQFKKPIVTPTTKAEIGNHDEDISPSEIVSNKILDKKMYEKLHYISLELFKRGTEIAEKSGLPKGVWNLVNGIGEEAGAALTKHKDIKLKRKLSIKSAHFILKELLYGLSNK